MLKLAALPKAIIDTILLSRGIDPAIITDIKATLAAIGVPITARDAVDYSFRTHGSPPTYNKGRFGDGSAPVFYGFGGNVKIIGYLLSWKFMQDILVGWVLCIVFGLGSSPFSSVEDDFTPPVDFGVASLTGFLAELPFCGAGTWLVITFGRIVLVRLVKAVQ